MADRLVGDRFEILDHIARGGMSSVYKARDSLGGGIVALKMMTPEHAADVVRFGRETSLLASVVHPNVVGYVAHGENAGMYYIAQEWVDGPNLAQRLRRAGHTAQEIVAIGGFVASALEAIHALGVVHRDVKPSNIIVPDELAHTKLVDFGIARFAASAGQLTRAGTAVGTPSYMAPEQARALTKIEPSADVWALGCVMYEALTGRQAYVGPSPTAIRAKVLVSELPALGPECPEAPAELVALIVDMLRKPPDQRPTSAEVGARLRALPPIPDGPRRKRQHGPSGDGEATRVIPTRAEGGAYVMVALPEDLSPEQATRVTEIAKLHALEAHFLEDGAALLAASAPGKAGAIAAVRAGLELRAEVFDGAVSVFGTPYADLFGAAIDHAAQALERAVIATQFADAGDVMRICVDDVIAELVGDEVAVSRTDDGPVVELAMAADRR